jgi:hypothetical protein
MMVELELDLEFPVFRGDVFDVPDWVHVYPGDYEEDHSFEASGSRCASYSARLVLGFAEEATSPNVSAEIADVTVEDIEFEDIID